MPSFTKAAILGLLTAAHAHQLYIYGDTNRDGVVDMKDDSDLAGRDYWEENRGALFLPILTDTGERCSQGIPDTEQPDEVLDSCNDSSDERLRHAKHLASIRTRPIDTLPVGERAEEITGTVTFTSKSDYERARLWRKEGDRWIYLKSDYIFDSEQLRKGLELGIDGRDVRRPTWDGKVNVLFEVMDGKTPYRDTVELRVAPVLTHHVKQNPHRMYVATMKDFMIDQKEFVQKIGEFSNQFNVPEPLFTFPEDQDLWTQDSFEAGYASIPDAGGQQKALRIMIKSARKDRDLGRRVFKNLRSATVGAVQHKATCNANIESLGNLETIPPYTHNNKHYPAGRVIMGKNGDFRPVMLDFIESQGVQDPLEMQTGWLATGHVDEFLQFVPWAKGRHGWALVASDAMAGFNLLKKAQNDKFGSEKAFSRGPQIYDIWKQVYNPTIDEVLALKDLEAIAEWAQEHIEENIEYIKKETGITDADIIRVPDLFYLPISADKMPIVRPELQKAGSSRVRIDKEGSQPCAGSRQPNSPKLRQHKNGSNWRVTSFFPAAINGAVFANGQYLAPKSWGPVVGNKNIFEEATNLAYAKVNHKVAYMDDFFDHHIWGGEVHCGTNMAREMTPWLPQLEASTTTTSTSTA